MVSSRRNFLRGMFALPVIVAIDHIMPVKAFELIKPAPVEIETFDPILIGMIRRVMPNIIAQDILGVQQIINPCGEIFLPYTRTMAFDAGVFYAPYVPLQVTGAEMAAAEFGAESIRKAEDKQILEELKKMVLAPPESTWCPGLWEKRFKTRYTI